MTDDDEVVRDLAEELTEAPPMETVWRPTTAFEIAGLIQLALRYPGVSDSLRATGERFLSAVRQHFAEFPTATDVLRRGDDPNEDR